MGEVIPYDMQRYVSKNLLTSTNVLEVKYKFYSYNSSLTVQNFFFNEITSLKPIEGTLFVMRRAPYKWLKVQRCKLKLLESISTTIEGVNHEFSDTDLDISAMNTLLWLYRVDECAYYINPGMGHTLLWQNVTTTGNNVGGLTRLMIIQKPF
jgi:hypothetical protein